MIQGRTQCFLHLFEVLGYRVHQKGGRGGPDHPPPLNPPLRLCRKEVVTGLKTENKDREQGG